MTREQIDKLTDLKKLRDAGILTEEEMQAEKAKIIGSVRNQTNTKDDITECGGVSNVTDEVESQEINDLENASKDCSDISNDVEPSLEENTSITQEVKDNNNDTPLRENRFFIFLTVAFVVFGILIITLKVSKKTSETVYKTPDVVTNKFGFDNIVLVMDYETTAHIFHH